MHILHPSPIPKLKNIFNNKQLLEFIDKSHINSENWTLYSENEQQTGVYF